MDDEKIMEKFSQQSERISDALHFAMATNEKVENTLKHFNDTLNRLDNKIEKIGAKADKTDALEDRIGEHVTKMKAIEDKLGEFLGDKKFRNQSIFGAVLNVLGGVGIGVAIPLFLKLMGLN